MSDKKYPENQEDTKPEDKTSAKREAERESLLNFDPNSIPAVTMCVYAGPDFWNGGYGARGLGMAVTPAQNGKYCHVCGFKLTENANYCSECGAKVIKDT